MHINILGIRKTRSWYLWMSSPPCKISNCWRRSETSCRQASRTWNCLLSWSMVAVFMISNKLLLTSGWMAPYFSSVGVQYICRIIHITCYFNVNMMTKSACKIWPNNEVVRCRLHITWKWQCWMGIWRKGRKIWPNDEVVRCWKCDGWPDRVHQ